jgi:hypothetical protein
MWTQRLISIACNSPLQLYCFETAYNTVVTPTPPAAKRYAFVSTNAWTPTGGRGPGAGSADERCNLDKGSLPGTYVALLSTSTSPASDPARLDPSGPVWVRPDGIVIASTTANLFAGTTQAPINQQSDGTYLTNFNQVFTGGFVPNMTTGTAASESCTDWSVSTGTADVAYPISMYRWFGTGSTLSCTTAARLYCLQQ